MAKVTITISARNYEIACKDGQEDRIRELGNFINSKASSLGSSVHIGESLSLVMTSLILADELMEAKNSKNIPSVENHISNNNINLEEIDNIVSQEISEISNNMKNIASIIKKI